MPPALKKRKLNGVSATSNGSATTARGSIAAFGRISKPGVRYEPVSQEVVAQSDALFSKTCKVLDSDSTVPSKRRKLEELSNRPPQKLPSFGLSTPTKPIASSSYRGTRPTSSPATISTARSPLPAPKARKVAPRPKYAETPTKGARACLEAFVLASSSSPTSSVSPSSPLPTIREDTPPTSPIAPPSPCPVRDEEIDILPDGVQDLIDLHAAFLAALSIHYAHNGSFAPVDVRNLTPSVARAWGKRRVSLEDIRRILGVLGSGGSTHVQKEAPCPLELSDYRSGKICIELTELALQKGHRRQPLDVDTLKARFGTTIHHLWQQQPLPRTDPPAFISTLPLAPVSLCGSVSKISPLLAKGQRRLEDLKAGAIRAQAANGTVSQTPLPPGSSPQPKAANSRNSSLLDRIRAKELHQSTLPVGPSAAALARKAALQRLEEVVPVLEILTSRSAGGGGGEEERRTCSFTMPAVVQHLQTSLKNPISKEEAVRCVRLLGEEIAPGWVGVREVKKMVGVTVRNGVGVGVGRGEMLERIRVALEKRV